MDYKVYVAGLFFVSCCFATWRVCKVKIRVNEIGRAKYVWRQLHNDWNTTPFIIKKNEEEKFSLFLSVYLFWRVCEFEVHLMARFEPYDLYEEDFIMPTHILSFYRKEYTI